MTTLFTRTLTTGKTLTATYANGMLHIHIDGQYYTSGKSRPRDDLPTGYTHIVDNVPLTPSEHATYQAALEADPVEQRVALAATRDQLVRELNIAIEDAQARRDAAWDRHDDTPALHVDETAIHAARQALADFDAAHPEVRADQRARNIRAGEAA